MLRLLRKGRPQPDAATSAGDFDAIATPDIWEEFRSRSAWTAWQADHPAQTARDEAHAVARSARDLGVFSDFLGRLPASAVRSTNDNYREDLCAAGFNPRLRVVLDRLVALPGADDIWNFRIWGHEALTPFALALRGRFPLYFGSEYAADDAGRRKLFPIPAIDVTRAELPDATFDAVVSNEVFEHIPDLDAGLRECARVLKPGGRLLATFPFAYAHQETSVRAAIEDGEVRLFAPAEYHGNPTDPEKGSLVFQIPGWDILDRARNAGFRDPRMIFASSRRKGYTASELPGILLFEATR